MTMTREYILIETNLDYQIQLHLSLHCRTALPPNSLVGKCDERLTYKQRKTRKMGEPLKTSGKFSLSSSGPSWDTPIEDHWKDFQAAILKRDEVIREIRALSDQVVISIQIELIEEFPHLWFDPEFGRLLSELGAEFWVAAYRYD